MADIEFSDGSTLDIPGKREGETLEQFVIRQGEELDADYERFKAMCRGTFLGGLFGE